MDIYTAPIIQRLNAALPSFNFTATDVVAMQQLCGYETVIRNSSGFCNAFDEVDWLGFEYTNDLMYFYSIGYAHALPPYPHPPSHAYSHPPSGTATPSAPNSACPG
jgi:acid phosphatase